MNYRRTVFLAGAFLSSVVAWTDGPACFKELCVGNTVRNTQGWKSQVTGFDPDSAMVFVEMGETGAPWKFEYGELGKSVRCHEKFCVGEAVFDRHDNEGMVEEVYTNNLVYIYAPDFDGYFLYTADELRQPRYKVAKRDSNGGSTARTLALCR